MRRWRKERPPAVKEHLAELIQAAAEQTGCPAEALKVTVEEPTRARVEACGKTVTFRWGRARRKGLRKIEHWHQIDPDCRFDYMGCNSLAASEPRVIVMPSKLTQSQDTLAAF